MPLGSSNLLFANIFEIFYKSATCTHQNFNFTSSCFSLYFACKLCKAFKSGNFTVIFAISPDFGDELIGFINKQQLGLHKKLQQA